MNAETWTIIKVDKMDISLSKHGVGEKIWKFWKIKLEIKTYIL